MIHHLLYFHGYSERPYGWAPSEYLTYVSYKLPYWEIIDLDNYSDDWQMTNSIKWLQSVKDAKVLTVIEEKGLNSFSARFFDSVPSDFPLMIIGSDSRLQTIIADNPKRKLLNCPAKMESILEWLMN